jgi:hypothetical protein
MYLHIRFDSIPTLIQPSSLHQNILAPSPHPYILPPPCHSYPYSYSYSCDMPLGLVWSVLVGRVVGGESMGGTPRCASVRFRRINPSARPRRSRQPLRSSIRELVSPTSVSHLSEGCLPAYLYILYIERYLYIHSI